jgi:hypothetical protein
MNLYLAREKESDWCCFVFAENRGRAKSLFYKYNPAYDYLEFQDIRAMIIEKNVDGEEEVCDMDCDRLKKHGVYYDNSDY